VFIDLYGSNLDGVDTGGYPSIKSSSLSYLADMPAMTSRLALPDA
jgi:hypothetical protein